MKLEVILAVFEQKMKASEDQDEERGNSPEAPEKEEAHSPTDFINRAAKFDNDEKREENTIHQLSECSPDELASVALNVTTAVSPPVSLTFSSLNGMMLKQEPTQSVPLLPLDTPTFSLSQPVDSIHGSMPIIPVSIFNGQSLNREDIQGPSCVTLYTPDLKNGMLLESPFLYSCRWQQCDNRFAIMDDLVNHVNDYHVKVERPEVDYQCKWDGCPRRGKGFNARYKMLIHIRTHTNEKPHKCNLCGKSFSRLENLKIHHRSHTGEKPYICPFEGCNKAYSNSSDRFKHVRTHQEDKPYICKMPGCNKRYTDPSSLRKHVRTHGHFYRDNGQPELNCSPMSQNIVSPIHYKLSAGPQGSLASTMIASPGPVIPTPLLTVGSLANSNIMNIGLGGGEMHLPRLVSNPLLSSTILTTPVSTQTISTQTESVVTVTVSSATGSRNRKCQDSPLDLTTNPMSVAEEELHIINGQIVHSARLTLGPVGVGEDSNGDP